VLFCVYSLELPSVRWLIYWVVCTCVKHMRMLQWQILYPSYSGKSRWWANEWRRNLGARCWNLTTVVPGSRPNCVSASVQNRWQQQVYQGRCRKGIGCNGWTHVSAESIVSCDCTRNSVSPIAIMYRSIVAAINKVNITDVQIKGTLRCRLSHMFFVLV